jgi:Tol biopolymer transport system component
MDRDFIITIERFEAPWASMYLKNNPGLKMIDFGVYWASPKDASMVMEFSKPMDKESLKEAIAKIAPQEAEMDWQNNQKVIINFNPQSDDRKTYYLNFQGAKDKDGVLLSLLETIELHVTPDAELKKFDPVTGETADGIMVSGGYCGGVISPDGTKAVCWEASSYAGNANSYRYWLQDVATGKRVFLTSMIDNTVKWNPDGKQFQLGDMTYSAEGEKIETLSVEEQKYILGFDINSAGRIAYLCLGNQDQVALSYETGEGLKTIEGFTHPLVSDGVFYMRMNPSFDPAGKRLAVVENRSGGAALESGQVSVIDLETENKSLLAERAVGVSWSPDGEHIAITKHGGEIDILKPDGTKAVSLQDYEYNSLIGWSPDGKYLLLKKYREDCWKAHLYGVKTGDTKIIDGVPLSFDSDNVLYLLAK